MIKISHLNEKFALRTLINHALIDILALVTQKISHLNTKTDLIKHVFRDIWAQFTKEMSHSSAKFAL